MICSQCGTNVADDSTVCTQCGANISPAASSGPAGGPSVLPPSASAPFPGQPAATPRPGSSLPPFSFDAKRWSRAERITGIATLVLFISLFLPWFTYNFGLGTVSVDGLWHGWMYLVLLLSLGIMAYLVARAGFSEMPFKLPIAEAQLLLIATGINAVLSVLSFVFKPGGIGFSGIGWGFGAFVGLAAAVIAAAPTAVPAIQARRAGH
ncbi:MAG TPA: zinc ribbon domain-containing protein [Acidimicrobiales bacterium]|nr:zinc ribbon domain-containing protein [Acidimicrobiales bacterium]